MIRGMLTDREVDLIVALERSGYYSALVEVIYAGLSSVEKDWVYRVKNRYEKYDVVLGVKVFEEMPGEPR